MLTNSYEYMAIILRSLRLVANCIRKPIRHIFATIWRICREYIVLHSHGYSPQCETCITKPIMLQMFERISTHLLFVAAAEMFIDIEGANYKHHGCVKTVYTTSPSRGGPSHPIEERSKLGFRQFEWLW